LFDLPAERLRQTELWFAPGEYRYLRLSWDDTNSGRVRMPRGAAARRTVRTRIAAPSKIDVAFERGASEPGRTRYRIRLQAVRMPIVALELEVGGGHVFRQAAVTESRFAGTEAAPVQLGTATLSRVVRDGVHASNLRITTAPPSESELQLLIEDAGNPPLDVKRISAELAELPVIFFEHQDRPLIARYGNPTLEAPSYDLEAMRASIDVTKVNEATWGEPRALVETGAPAAPASAPEPGSVLETGGFAHVREISGAPAGLVTLQLDASALANSRGPAGRFADVRVLNGSNRQIPYLLERRGEPLEVPLSIGRVGSKAAELETAPGQHRSVYRVSLLHEGLPPATLVLDSPGRVFQRNVQIGFERPPDRRHRDTWFDVRSTTVWRHADQETPALPLSIRLDGAGPRDVLVVIDEGDNAPLPISGARLLLPSYRLRFYHPRDASLRLAYGRDDLEAPEYDLALLAQQVMGAAAREASAVPEAATDGDSSAPIIPPWTFWTLLGVAVVVLIAMIGRLARSA
jgi:hypothetical protein